MSITERLKELKSGLADHVQLVAVSKLKPEKDIQEAYATGQRAFGENYVQEMAAKAENLPKDIQWHFIGHLQSNKVKYIAPFVHLIHSVDSFKLLQEINKQAEKNQRVIDCLLQLHIAEEETKSGMDTQELLSIFSDGKLQNLKNVRIIGLMGMSTFTDDEEQIKKEFRTLAEIARQGKILHPDLREISMGMSGDWPLAVAEGSTIIRVGSTIFGSR